MIAIERLTQEIHSGKRDELEELDKKYSVVESRLGFPPKRRFLYVFGGHNNDTIVVERQWESMAAMEAAYEKALADAEFQALGHEAMAVVKSTQYEMLAPLP